MWGKLTNLANTNSNGVTTLNGKAVEEGSTPTNTVQPLPNTPRMMEYSGVGWVGDIPTEGEMMKNDSKPVNTQTNTQRVPTLNTNQ